MVRIGAGPAGDQLRASRAQSSERALLQHSAEPGRFCGLSLVSPLYLGPRPQVIFITRTYEAVDVHSAYMGIL